MECLEQRIEQILVQHLSEWMGQYLAIYVGPTGYKDKLQVVVVSDSDHFEGESLLHRGKLIFEVLAKHLSQEERGKVTMLMALTWRELRGFFLGSDLGESGEEIKPLRDLLLHAPIE